MRSRWLGAIVVAALIVAGCSSADGEADPSPAETPGTEGTDSVADAESVAENAESGSDGQETASGPEPPVFPARSEFAGSLPNLDEGQYVGFKSFSPIEDVDPTALDGLTQEAVDAGVDVGRVFLDWYEVEPSLGEYQFEEFRAELAGYVERGQQPVVGLLIGAGEDGPAVPAELAEPFDGDDGPTELRSDLRLDSPEVVDAYLEMLDQLLPEIVEAETWLLTLSNEPDNLFHDLPAAEAIDIATQLAGFMVAVREHVQEVDPGLAVTFTNSGFSIENPPPGLDVLIGVSDVVSSNFGCLDPATIRVYDLASVQRTIDALIELADGRQVVIQELSCHSGPLGGESPTGASPEYQAEWFETFFAIMDATPELRAAFVLDLVDWPDWLGAAFSDFLRDEGLTEWADGYYDVLTTWGLVTQSLEKKPAWNVFLEQAAAQEAIRE